MGLKFVPVFCDAKFFPRRVDSGDFWKGAPWGGKGAQFFRKIFDDHLRIKVAGNGQGEIVRTQPSPVIVLQVAGFHSSNRWGRPQQGEAVGMVGKEGL